MNEKKCLNTRKGIEVLSGHLCSSRTWKKYPVNNSYAKE